MIDYNLHIRSTIGLQLLKNIINLVASSFTPETLQW